MYTVRPINPSENIGDLDICQDLAIFYDQFLSCIVFCEILIAQDDVQLKYIGFKLFGS